MKEQDKVESKPRQNEKIPQLLLELRSKIQKRDEQRDKKYEEIFGLETVGSQGINKKIVEWRGRNGKGVSSAKEEKISKGEEMPLTQQVRPKDCPKRTLTENATDTWVSIGAYGLNENSGNKAESRTMGENLRLNGKPKRRPRIKSTNVTPKITNEVETQTTKETQDVPITSQRVPDIQETEEAAFEPQLLALLCNASLTKIPYGARNVRHAGNKAQADEVSRIVKLALSRLFCDNMEKGIYPTAVKVRSNVKQSNSTNANEHNVLINTRKRIKFFCKKYKDLRETHNQLSYFFSRIDQSVKEVDSCQRLFNDTALEYWHKTVGFRTVLKKMLTAFYHRIEQDIVQTRVEHKGIYDELMQSHDEDVDYMQQEIDVERESCERRIRAYQEEIVSYKRRLAESQLLRLDQISYNDTNSLEQEGKVQIAVSSFESVNPDESLRCVSRSETERSTNGCKLLGLFRRCCGNRKKEKSPPQCLYVAKYHEVLVDMNETKRENGRLEQLLKTIQQIHVDTSCENEKLKHRLGDQELKLVQKEKQLDIMKNQIKKLRKVTQVQFYYKSRPSFEEEVALSSIGETDYETLSMGNDEDEKRHLENSMQEDQNLSIIGNDSLLPMQYVPISFKELIKDITKKLNWCFDTQFKKVGDFGYRERLFNSYIEDLMQNGSYLNEKFQSVGAWLSKVMKSLDREQKKTRNAQKKRLNAKKHHTVRYVDPTESINVRSLKAKVASKTLVITELRRQNNNLSSSIKVLQQQINRCDVAEMKKEVLSNNGSRVKNETTAGIFEKNSKAFGKHQLIWDKESIINKGEHDDVENANSISRTALITAYSDLKSYYKEQLLRCKMNAESERGAREKLEIENAMLKEEIDGKNVSIKLLESRVNLLNLRESNSEVNISKEDDCKTVPWRNDDVAIIKAASNGKLCENVETGGEHGMKEPVLMEGECDMEKEVLACQGETEKLSVAVIKEEGIAPDDGIQSCCKPVPLKRVDKNEGSSCKLEKNINNVVANLDEVMNLLAKQRDIARMKITTKESEIEPSDTVFNVSQVCDSDKNVPREESVGILQEGKEDQVDGLQSAESEEELILDLKAFNASDTKGKTLKLNENSDGSHKRLLKNTKVEQKEESKSFDLKQVDSVDSLGDHLSTMTRSLAKELSNAQEKINSLQQLNDDLFQRLKDFQNINTQLIEKLKNRKVEDSEEGEESILIDEQECDDELKVPLSEDDHYRKKMSTELRELSIENQVLLETLKSIIAMSRYRRGTNRAQRILLSGYNILKETSVGPSVPSFVNHHDDVAFDAPDGIPVSSNPYMDMTGRGLGVRKGKRKSKWKFKGQMDQITPTQPLPKDTERKKNRNANKAKEKMDI